MNNKMDNNLSLQLSPYQLKGRWYKIFVESNGTEPTITESDISAAIATNTLVLMPEHFQIVDVKADINLTESVAGLPVIVRRYQDSAAFSLPEPDTFDYATYYVFGYYK